MKEFKIIYNILYVSLLSIMCFKGFQFYSAPVDVIDLGPLSFVWVLNAIVIFVLVALCPKFHLILFLIFHSLLFFQSFFYNLENVVSLLMILSVIQLSIFLFRRKKAIPFWASYISFGLGIVWLAMLIN